MVLTYLAGDVGAGLVGHPRKNDVAAGALARAGGGLFGEVFAVVYHVGVK
jgi:hypothetical protein